MTHSPSEQATLWPTAIRSTPRSLAERPLKEWPLHERPIERLYDAGATAVSDAELLAAILGSTGTTNPVALAGELLAHGGLLGLQRLSIQEIAALPGMTRQRAAQIKAALELGRRLLLASVDDRPQIRSPADVAQLLMIEMGHLDQEQLRVVLLDTKNRVQKIHTAYIGSLNSSMVRIGEVFKEAIRLNSAAIVYVRWNITLKRHTLPNMEKGPPRDLKERSGHEQYRLGTLRPRDPPTTRPCLAHHARQPWVGPQYPHCLCGRP